MIDSGERAWCFLSPDLLAFDHGPAGGGFHSILFSKLQFCPVRECECREVQLEVVDLEIRLPLAALKSDKVEAASRLQDSPRGAAIVDLDLGSVEPDTRSGSRPLDPDRIAVLVGAIDGELLDQLHGRWLREKSWKARVLGPDDLPAADALVAWSKVCTDGRLDLFDVAGHVYLADDTHCLNQDCDCSDVHVTFFKDVGSKRFRELGAVRFDLASGAVAERVADRRVRPTLDALWEAYCRRHRVGERLADHRRCLRDLASRRGPLAAPRASASSAASPGLLPPRPARTPGRNAPCPCGSGKKFKRCCGA